jgi:tetratricopeptide (TPR) repeat protein
MAVKNGNPADAESYKERGSGYLGTREWDKAIADFNEVIRLEPERSGGYSSRGLCYEAKGDYDRAIADFNEAIRRSPDNPTRYESRGETYLKKGDHDKAIADFSEAICKREEFFSDEPEYHDDQASLYTLRGITYAAKGDFGAANADWETVLQMDMVDRIRKMVVKNVIAIVKKQQANGSGKLTIAPNLLAMGFLRISKTKAVVNFIYMVAGAAAGAVIGILIGNGVLAFFLAGFLGTLKGSIGNISAGSKTSAGESKTAAVLISLVLSLIIAPVWFVIKFFKRIKAFFWIRSVGKRLSQKVIPDAIEEIQPLVDYIDTI